MSTTIDVTGRYWETYDDQESSDFNYVGYQSLGGDQVVESISSDLAMQVAEIKRKNGKSTEVRVYR